MGLMETNNTILIELKEISPVVAALPAQHPFDIPAGYFDNFPARVMSLIKREEDQLPLILKNNNKFTPFAVPENYFETLPAVVLNVIKSSEAANPHEELEIISPFLGQLEKKHPFNIPD